MLNLGLSGYNSRWLRHMLECEIMFRGGRGGGTMAAVPVVVIFLGANDAVVESVSCGQSVPIDEYTQNLEAIVENLRTQFTRAEVLMITPPPIAEGMRIEYVRENYHGSELDRTNDRARTYADAVVDLARKLDVRALDLHAEMTEAAAGTSGVDRFLNDGLHLSIEGNAFVASAVERELCLLMEVSSLDQVSEDHPEWSVLARDGNWRDALRTHHDRQKKCLEESKAAFPRLSWLGSCNIFRRDSEVTRSFVIGAGLACIQAGIFVAVACNRYYRNRGVLL